MRAIYLFLFVMPSVSFAQPLNVKGNQGGIVSAGVRTTVSAFNGHENETTGLGVGGQFRIQFADRVNSEWFFDYINSDIGDFAHRTDYHIGWSVLFYPLNQEKPIVRPYILAGHCFDYTRLTDNGDSENFDERWSSAVQGGIGTHFNLSDRLDLSLTSQYMIHLGNEVHADRHNATVEFHEHKGASLEGHLLFNLGIHYKIGDVW